MSDWPRERLDAMTAFAGGVAFPRAEQGGLAGQYPFLKVSDMNTPGNERELHTSANWVTEEQRKRLRARLWPAGTVVFPKVGAALKTEKRRLLTRPSAFDNNVMGLVPGDQLLPRFLLALMEKVRFGAFAQEGVVPSINQRLVGEIEIPVPPLEAQRRIVALLEAFDRTRDTLELQRAHLRRLKVLVLQDAYTSAGGELRSIGHLLSHTIGGLWGEERGQDEVDVEVVRSTNYDNDGLLHLEDAAHRSISKKQLATRALERDDILLEKSGGGPKQPVGRVVRVRDDLPEHVCSNFVQLLRPDAQEIDPAWLFYRLWSDHATGLTLQYQAVAVGIRNLRTKDYLAREIPVPHPDVQRRIGALGDALDSELGALDGQAEALDALYSSCTTALLEGRHELQEVDAHAIAAGVVVA